ncbi:MAG: fluoride efflux transporter CrcB [Sphingobium sp.]|nr:fluoride efflux transporter CrcB [Sphingobium sp.]
MVNILLVMAGGAIGSALRYLFGKLSFHLFGPNPLWGWPWGTLGVNVIGGLVMGLFVGWMAARAQGGEYIRLFFAVGVLGGFTTFSSFSLEAMLLIERGELVSAATYALISVFASITALAIGLGVMRAVA